MGSCVGSFSANYSLNAMQVKSRLQEKVWPALPGESHSSHNWQRQVKAQHNPQVYSTYQAAHLYLPVTLEIITAKKAIHGIEEKSNLVMKYIIQGGMIPQC